jgi:hypothetical protein
VKKQRDLEIEGEWVFKLQTIELGRNRRDKPVTSCIVVAADPADVKPRGPKLNMWEKMAIENIKEMISRYGQESWGDLPRGKVLTEEHWRNKWFVTASIDDPGKKRVTWKRTKDRLIELRVVGHSNGYVWLVQEDSDVS